MYYNYRYISPCEVAWRIFGYGIHFRDLFLWYVYDSTCQPSVFQDHENLEDIAKKTSMKESMFQANKKYSDTQSLTYAKFPSKFVWKSQSRKWFPCKSHSVFGQICFLFRQDQEKYTIFDSFKILLEAQIVIRILELLMVFYILHSKMHLCTKYPR
ncbi:hypothetical protein Ahy_B09g096016 [Arachis hypogaea]|uniref:Uncharacterized protein n=1 Tax=Arachis hypogaea TaxID=3818 RepID=A0A444XHU9_ARAHY|nr:hypothetical protein Ahy_B09g096016 [Arachis hypogaea]